MGFYKKNKQEIMTLHLISQIIGKVKLEYAAQEPQWAHIILNITPRGFSTGLLKYDASYFEVEVNLIQSLITIKTEEEEAQIELKNGKTISDYYKELIDSAATVGLELSISTKPQEMKWTTPFPEDFVHHHYNEASAKRILKWFQFAWDVEQHFIAPFRQRKVYPGLFWGTFDLSCVIIYNKFEPFSNDNKVIEKAAFDEHMIEFGFWLGDDDFENPTFFTLPYPFVEDITLKVDDTFPRGSYFSSEMAEYLFEMKHGVDQADPIKVMHFMKSSCRKSLDYLEWQNTEHFFTELKMEDNQKQ